MYLQLLVVIQTDQQMFTQEDHEYLEYTIRQLSKQYAVQQPYHVIQSQDAIPQDDLADYIVTFTKTDTGLTHKLEPYESSKLIAGNS